MADEEYPGATWQDYRDVAGRGIAWGKALARWALFVALTVVPIVLAVVKQIGWDVAFFAALSGLFLWDALVQRIMARRWWGAWKKANDLTAARSAIIERMGRLQNQMERIQVSAFDWRKLRQVTISPESDQGCWDDVRTEIAEARTLVQGTEYEALLGLRYIPPEAVYEMCWEVERGFRRDLENVIRRMEDALPPRVA